MLRRPDCESCPAAEGMVCAAVAHPRYCALAAARPEARPVIASQARPPAPPPPVPAPARAAREGEVVFRGHGNGSGYGRVAMNLMKALGEAGQATAFEPVEGPGGDFDPFFRGRLLAAPHPGPLVQVSSPWAVRSRGNVLLSMWESSDLPPESVATYNTGRVMVLPCEWNRMVFRRSGVTIPLRVVPLGVDPSVHRPAAWPGGGGFTVLTVADVSGGGHRKGVDRLIRAFVEALGDREDAVLRVKTSPANDLGPTGHPRVVVDRGSYDEAGLARLYASCDAYMTMTAGEGWGLPVLEAMAAGRPVIAPLHTGIADFATPECSYPLEFAAEPASGPYYEGHGDWYPPSHRSAVDRLRAAYADRDGLRRRGDAAGRRAADFPWSRSARELLAVLREFGLAAPSPPPAGRPAHPAAVRPSVSAQLDLARLRRECPDGTKPPGCGCSDELICARGKGVGGMASRATCYSCLRERGDAP